MSSCPVCCENIRFNIICEKCKYNCCRVCVRTYLCGQLTEPHCMNCKTKWDLNFVEDAVGSTFFKSDFKKALSNTYYEFEKTQLPLIQDNIKEFLFNERNQNLITNLINENKKKLVGRYGCFNCVGDIYYNDDCNQCDDGEEDEVIIHRDNVCKYLFNNTIPLKYISLIKELKIKNFWSTTIIHYNNKYKCICGESINMDVTTDDYYKCRRSNKCKNRYCKKCLDVLNEDNTHKNNICIPMSKKKCPCVDYICDKCTIDINKLLCTRIKALRYNGTSAEDTEKRKFIMKCQVPNCIGFLSTHYKCGVCDVTTCSECLDVKDTDHVCKKDNIETAKMIKKETRPCPTCATRIYKIDGCDQMWCVDCKTAFSWNTGQISNSKIHNPHYYEYLRQTQGSVPRDPGDIPGGAAAPACVQFPDSSTVRSYLLKLKYNPDPETSLSFEDSDELKEITRKLNNIYSFFVNNVTEFHKFIVEMDALIRPNNVNIYNNDLIRCRVLYSLKRMDIDTFKRNTYMYHQKSQHHNNYMQVMEMFKQICRDMFEYIIDIIKNLDPLNKLQSLNGLSIIEKKTIQYKYLLERNNKVNDIYKQLINSIIYIQKNLTKNKYYVSACDNSSIYIKMKKYTEEDISAKYHFNSQYLNILGTVEVSPLSIKWDSHAYAFYLKYNP